MYIATGFLASAMLTDRAKVLSAGLFLPFPFAKDASQSVGPESGHGLAGCLWLEVSHGVPDQLPIGPPGISRLGWVGILFQDHQVGG